MPWAWASAHRGKWGQLTPWKNGRNIKKRKHAKNSSFLCLCYTLRAIRAGRCRERRYADHIFIQIYFRMHHFVVKFSKFSPPQAAGGIDPLTKILRKLLAVSRALPIVYISNDALHYAVYASIDPFRPFAAFTPRLHSVNVPLARDRWSQLLIHLHTSRADL